jgi:hypothetical protein
MSNDAGGTKRNQKGPPFFHRGRNPRSLANLQKRGKPSNNPSGRRGAHSLQSELQRIVFGPEWEKLKRHYEQTSKMLDRIFLKRFGVTADEALERYPGRR